MSSGPTNDPCATRQRKSRSSEFLLALTTYNWFSLSVAWLDKGSHSPVHDDVWRQGGSQRLQRGLSIHFLSIHFEPSCPFAVGG